MGMFTFSACTIPFNNTINCTQKDHFTKLEHGVKVWTDSHLLTLGIPFDTFSGLLSTGTNALLVHSALQARVFLRLPTHRPTSLS